MDLSLTDEQHRLIELARDLASRHSPHPYVSWEDAGKFPWEFCRELASHGLTGIDIPESHGGQGLRLIDSVLVMDAIGSTAPHLGDAVQATNFGAIRQLAAFANPRVKDEVLRPLLRGDGLVTVAISEPNAGSAISNLQTRAVELGDRIRVTGQKIFNSNGPHATHYVVWARFGTQSTDIGAVVVPADTPGCSRGKTQRYLSGEAHCTLHFDGIEVPKEYVLVAGDGIRKMMPVFNIERIGNATRSVALGELALRLAINYMLERKPEGHPLADHQGLQWKIADARMRLDAARLLIYRAALQLKDSAPDPLFTSIAKCFSNEAGFEAANQALQIFGGYGFSEDSPFRYLLMRTRGWMIAGGSVEVQRNRIAKEVLRRHRI